MQPSVACQHFFHCLSSQFPEANMRHTYITFALCTLGMVDPGLLTLAQNPDISELSGFTLEGAVLQKEEHMVLFQLQRETQRIGKNHWLPGRQKSKTLTSGDIRVTASTKNVKKNC
ncbi:hypothetical protein XENORESO_013257 [Xenotaenia resolanae]|uniref:Uncharacterized protein n=1 Tax=Xenotaenia resolanae TaxID=208358 RepID=A0ABV0VMH7_9TELE